MVIWQGKVGTKRTLFIPHGVYEKVVEVRKLYKVKDGEGTFGWTGAKTASVAIQRGIENA